MTFYIENEKLDVDEFMTLDPTLEFFAEALKKYSSEIRDAQVIFFSLAPFMDSFLISGANSLFILVCAR